MNSKNVAIELPGDVLNQIGARVKEEFDIDNESRALWIEKNTFAMELATQVVAPKSEPFDGAANIKFPTLAMSAVQFAARAYPQLFQGTDIVKGKVIGKDEGGVKAGIASRIAEHMSYQIIEEMDDWEDQTDGLLTALPIEGCEFKKSYYSPSKGRNVSEWLRPKDVVINYHAKSPEEAPRVSHILRLYPNDVRERVLSGVFLDLAVLRARPEKREEEDTFDVKDDDAPLTFIEQHRYLDLDNDGYREPYIVTIHRDSQKVVRIMPRFDLDGIRLRQDGRIMRIEPIHYFTRFLFMQNPDGGVYGMGFGMLLGPINTSINITLNQIHDAGTLANTQGGFIGKSFSGGRGGQAGDLRFKMGEFKQVKYSGDDIRKSVMPLPFKGPDMVLFQVLGLLIESGEKLGSITDPVMGESPGSNVPATTTLALIEQGTKVFSSVFKRIHRSFRSEFRKLFRLNEIFLDEEVYFNIMDSPKSIKRQDYNSKTNDVVPVSDPNMVSNTQQMLKAEVLKGFMGMGLDDQKIMTTALEAMNIPDWEEFIPDDPEEPEPDPKIIIEMMKLDQEQQKIDLAMFEMQFKVLKIQADAMKSLAQAEAAEESVHVKAYEVTLKAMTEKFKAQQQGVESAKDRATKEAKSITK
jgi:chaperonin GroES